MSRASSRLYSILEVGVDADHVTLRRAFKRLSTAQDSAATPGDPVVAARLRGLRFAYEVLADPERRALYDEFGDRSLKKGFDPAAARRAQEREKREAERRAKAALVTPTAVVRPVRAPTEGSPNGTPATRDWDLRIAIGVTLARRGGQLRVPVTRPVPCPRCEGSGRREGACPTCEGQRRVIAQRLEPCAPCHGIGLAGEWTPCRGCARTGKRRGRACSRCDGAGTVVRRTDCQACSGRGIRVIRFEQPCGACRNTGEASCRRCDGNGTLPKSLALRLQVPRPAVPESVYRYASAGFSTHDGAPTDLYVQFAILARAPRRKRRR